ncbi:MAG: dihydroneopterin aldolase [Prevotellaceae bacterium]|nr:dihydroneopterin aldolase [Prevotellaceae bacterium]
MQSIILKDLRFYSYHGVIPQERRIGAYFIINVKITTDFTKAAFTDELKYTINYAEIYETIKNEMAQPSKLLEHVAGRIVTKLFDEYPSIDNIEFCIFKENPPIGTDNGKTGIEMNVSRSEMEKLKRNMLLQ